MRKDNKKEKLYIFIGIAVFVIIIAACLTFQIIIPSINTIREIGFIKAILRVFGAIGAFIWFYVFYIISEKLYEKRGSYGLSIVTALLAIFCMGCSLLFLPE